MVELLPNATADALRLFARIPTAATAHAVTADRIKALELFPKSRRPDRGKVLDMEYQVVPGENFYRLRMADESYAGRGDLCALFSAFPAAPQDGEIRHLGTIVVIGFCWWSDELPEISKERARHRYEQYVRRCR